MAAQVAERAGVSVMTVSRTFSGAIHVAEATRNRVMKAAEELGYVPNTSARALRTGRSGTIGLLLPHVGWIAGEFHVSTFASIEASLTERGYTMMLGIVSSHEEFVERASQFAHARQCEALVARSDVGTGELAAQLAKLPIPVVMSNYAPLDGGPCPVHTVGFDNAGGAAMAVRHLAALGHRRIAHIGGSPEWIDAMHRREGFLAAMKEVGLEVVDRWLRTASFQDTFDRGLEEMGRILSSSWESPTAVVCDSDDIAFGAITAALRWGKRVPQDLSVIGFDDSRPARMYNPPLTSVRHNGFDLGRSIAAVLDRVLEDPSLKPQQTLIDMQLIIRESTESPPD